jgi:hypothetical protein
VGCPSSAMIGSGLASSILTVFEVSAWGKVMMLYMGMKCSKG